MDNFNLSTLDALSPDLKRPAMAMPSRSENNDQIEASHQKLIEVSSTYDADLVLRKIMEDRASILTLRGKIEKNESELMSAKVWQLQAKKSLDSNDENVQRQIQKTKNAISEYNESSKQYIRGFMSAFESGDIEQLPQIPFLPNLHELEDAISKRKVALIEKIQADNRVQKLEHIKSQNRITKNVLKKNEEAFLRAIALAKQQFSDSCGSWLGQVNKLLSEVPSSSSNENDTRKSPNNIGAYSSNYREATGARMSSTSHQPMTNNAQSPRKRTATSESYFSPIAHGRMHTSLEPELKRPHMDSNHVSNFYDSTFAQVLQNSKDKALQAKLSKHNVPRDKHGFPVLISPIMAKNQTMFVSPQPMRKNSLGKPEAMPNHPMDQSQPPINPPVPSKPEANLEVPEINRGQSEDTKPHHLSTPPEALSVASSTPQFEEGANSPQLKKEPDQDSTDEYEKSSIQSNSNMGRSDDNQTDEASIAEVLTRMGSEA